MREWVQELQGQLRDYIPTELPEEKKGTGVLFCKICQQIRSCTCVVSEMTTPNRNVIFEHGFAIATGARAIMARDVTKKTSSRLDVLTDIERIDYQNVEDVALHIVQLGTDRELERVLGPDGEPKLLGEWDISSRKTDYGRLCFLRTQEANTDSLRRISRTLRSSGFSAIDTVDPEEHATHRLFEYCCRMKEAFGVVGHFVSDECVDHETDNALTALLLGLAVGLGKRIFVLQERPFERPMIDLGGVLKPYETRAELETMLARCLAAWHDIASRERAEGTKRAQVAATQSGAIELGHAAAEQDEALLLRAYYEAGYSQWAIRGKKFLVAGSKGSGKSALYLYALNKHELKQRRRLLAYELTDVEVQQLFEVATSWSTVVAAELFFRAFWRFNMLVDIVDDTFRPDDPSMLQDDDLRAVVEWRRGISVREGVDYVGRFLEYVGGTDSTPATKARFVKARFAEIEQRLKLALSGYEVIILADGLDAGWDGGSVLSRQLVRAFVHECFLLRQSMPETVKPVLFLRLDIIEQLKEGVQEADKWDIGYLRWTRAQLQSLLENRIIANQDGDAGPVDWTAILPQDIKGQCSIEYLLDRTYLRPRDAIKLLEQVIEQGQADGGLPAGMGAVLRGVSVFAKDRALNLSLELLAARPGLAAVINGVLPLFTLARPAFASDITSHCRTLAPGIADWLSNEPVRALYDAGVFVLQDADGRLMWAEDIPYDRACQLVQTVGRPASGGRRWLLGWLQPRKSRTTEFLVHLHPALHGLLGTLSDPVALRGRQGA
jgi:hypothetical protein